MTIFVIIHLTKTALDSQNISRNISRIFYLRCCALLFTPRLLRSRQLPPLPPCYASDKQDKTVMTCSCRLCKLGITAHICIVRMEKIYLIKGFIGINNFSCSIFVLSCSGSREVDHAQCRMFLCQLQLTPRHTVVMARLSRSALHSQWSRNERWILLASSVWRQLTQICHYSNRRGDDALYSIRNQMQRVLMLSIWTYGRPK